MTAALPTLGSPERPVRISVIGSSVTYMVVPRAGRTDASFGEWLPHMLRARGVSAEVAHVSTWFGLIHRFRTRYPELRDQHADVVVIGYGTAEAQPRLIPTRLLEHLTTWNVSTFRPAQAYRTRMAPPLWRMLRSLQRWGAARDRGRSHRLSPRRFGLEVRMLAARLRDDLGAHVLVLDLDPPGSRVLHFIPSQAERVAAYNRVLADAIEEFDDPEVVLVTNSHTVPPHRVDEFLPDGFHRSSEGHRLTAALLADHVATWLAGQQVSESAT